MGWTRLLDKNDKTIGTVGDEGWDLAGDFVEAFQKLYRRKVGRPATLDEVISSINFVYDTCSEAPVEEKHIMLLKKEDK
jgi:hypothetical protein